MVGLPEILILAVILLLVFGYKRLPQLGRSAGKGLRSAGESAKRVSGTVGDKVGEQTSGKLDSFDPSSIGKSAGRGLREAREFKDALTGKAEPEPEPRRRTAASADRPAPADGSAPAAASSAADAEGSPPPAASGRDESPASR